MDGSAYNILYTKGSHAHLLITGYALLYESMLDSVLQARDRFLKPGGLVAPSESRMVLTLCQASGVRKSHIEFWEDIYGTLSIIFLNISCADEYH